MWLFLLLDVSHGADIAFVSTRTGTRCSDGVLLGIETETTALIRSAILTIESTVSTSCLYKFPG